MSDGDGEALDRELAQLEARMAQGDQPRASVIDELARVRADLTRRGGAPFRLDELRISTPCKARWSDMTGDDRVRVCNACARPVFDLSKLTRADAEAVLATRGITPCVRLHRRADGTVITADCPTGVRTPRRRLAVVAGAIAAGAALLAASPASAGPPVPEATQTSGAIQGVIKDAATGEPLIGATVVATDATSSTSEATITDENGCYRMAELPPGEYVVTIYFAEMTEEHPGVRVAAGATSVVHATLVQDGETIVVEGHAPIIDQGSLTTGITIDRDYLTGIPVPGRSFSDAFGAAVAEPPAPPLPAPPSPPAPRPRSRLAWSSWLRVGAGVARDAPAGIARLIAPPVDDRHVAWDAALGADLSLGLAWRGELRVGAWAEARASSGPVLGLELLDDDEHELLALRAGVGADLVTAALAYGYRGARLVISANRALDDPRDWSAIAGVEVDPRRALRYLLARRSRP